MPALGSHPLRFELNKEAAVTNSQLLAQANYNVQVVLSNPPNTPWVPTPATPIPAPTVALHPQLIAGGRRL